MKKGLSLLLAIVLIAGSLAGCADSGSGSKTAFRSLYSSDVSTLNYLNTTTTNDMGIPANSQECLIQYDTLGNVQACSGNRMDHLRGQSDLDLQTPSGCEMGELQG